MITSQYYCKDPMHFQDKKQHYPLYVDWKLLNGCNYSCSYCHIDNVNDPEEYTKSLILETAYTILSQPRSEYIFKITGGEPTLHPYFYDLLAYLYSQPLNIKIIIDTNGSRSLDYYKRLLQLSPPLGLQFNISIHLDYTNVEHIINLVRLIKKYSQNCNIALFFPPGSDLSIAKSFYTPLLKVCSEISVLGRIVFINGDVLSKKTSLKYSEKEQAWAISTNTSFPNARFQQENILYNDFWDISPYSLIKSSKFSDKNSFIVDEHLKKSNHINYLGLFCCTGTTVISINAQGCITNNICSVIQNSMNSKRDISSQNLKKVIIHCKENICLSPYGPLLPKFREQQDADQYMEAFQAYISSRILQHIVLAPPHLPHNNKSCVAAHWVSLLHKKEALLHTPSSSLLPIKSSLKQDVWNTGFPSASAQISLSELGKNIEDITFLYSSLEDNQSRDVLIRALKTWESGDTGWICDSPYPPFAHPAQGHMEENPLSSGCILSPYLLRLTPGEIQATQLTKWKKRISYYKPMLEIAVPTPQHLLHAIALLRGIESDYKIYLGQHGKILSKNIVWLYAAPKRTFPVRSVACLQNTDSPSISIIIELNDNGDSLPRCIASLLFQNGVNLEIILVDNASNDSGSQIANEYQNQFPSLFKTIRFAERQAQAKVYNTGLDIATGKTVLFLNPDDILLPDTLSRALRYMADQQCYMVVFKMAVSDGSEDFYTLQQEKKRLVGFDAIELLLDRALNTSEDILSGCFYDNIFLRKCRSHFDNTNFASSLFFTLHLCAFSTSVFFTDEVGLVTSSSKKAHIQNQKKYSVINLIESLILKNLFFEAHEEEQRDSLSKMCTQKMYRAFKEQYLCGKNIPDDKSYIFSAWSDLQVDKDIIFTLIELFLEDINKIVLQNEPSYSFHDINSVVPVFYQIDKSTSHVSTIPQISIIFCVLSPNQTLWEDFLHYITSNMSISYELIIVVSASGEEAQLSMEHYATMYPTVHIYLTQQQASLCECRNIGLEKAQGNWIFFLKDSDITEKDFCSTLSGQNFLDNTNDYDIALFNTLSYDAEGNLVRSFSSPQGHNESPLKMLCLLMSATSLPPLCGFLFRKSILKKHHLYFTNSIISESLFLLRTLCVCTRLSVIPSFLCGSTTNNLSLGYRKTAIQLTDLDILDDLASVAKSVSTFEKRTLPENILTAFHELAFSHLETCLDNAVSPSSLVARLKEHLSEIKNGHNALQIMICAALWHYVRKHVFKTVERASLPSTTVWRQSFSSSPLVTVLVIVEQGGHEAKLDSCLNALAQQYILDFEVLVLDPFSSSSIVELCAIRTNKDCRFSLLNGNPDQKELLNKIHGRYVFVLYHQCLVSTDFLFRVLSVMDHDPSIELAVHSLCNSEEVESETFPHNIVLGGKELFGQQIATLFEHPYKYSFIARYNFLEKNGPFTNTLHLCTDNHGDVLSALQLIYYAQKVFYTKDSTSIRMPELDFTEILHTKNTSPSGKSLYLFKELCPLIQTLDGSLTHVLAEKAFIHFQTALGLWASRATSGIVETETLLDSDIATYFCSTPDVALRLLEDYAQLYAARTHYCPSIPPEEYHPTFALRVPSQTLLPLSPPLSSKFPVRISVIVPAFNVAPFIGVCLDSILMQLPDGMEIILVEDCSTEDNTLALCLEYAQRFPQIRLFRTPTNSGLGAVRNLALEQAAGEYITFVDSDDWLEAGFLLEALRLMDNDPGCELSIFSSQRWVDIAKNDFWPMQKRDSILTGKECLEAYVTGSMNHWTAWGIVYRASFVKSFSFGTLLYEDVLWAFTCFSKASRVRLSSLMAYNYRYDSQSSIMRPKVKGLLYFISSLHIIEIGTRFLESEPQLYAVFCRHFFLENKYQKNDILHYIAATKVLGRPSPLTSDRCRILLSSPYFAAAILADYLSLSPCRLVGQKIKIDTAIYKIVTGNSGIIGTVSFQDVVSEKFLRHKDSLLHKHPDKADKLFAIDSSFVPQFQKEGFLLRCSNPGMENHYISRDAANRFIIAPGIQKAFIFHFVSASSQLTSGVVGTLTSSPKASPSKIFSLPTPPPKKTTPPAQSVQPLPIAAIRRIDWDTLVSPEIWKQDPLKAVEISLRRSGVFDTHWYLEKYPDVAQAKMDPIYHYVHHGASEGRCPVPWFTHQPVKTSTNNLNPLYDYIQTLIANHKSTAHPTKTKKDCQTFAEVITDRPKVSVLVPIYNNVQYLPKCIESILSQRLRNIEVLCINDGSTDPEVVPLLEKYCRLDSRIRLISKMNTGYGHSMNVGIDQAIGEYIGIVESDDYIHPDMFERMYSVAKSLSLPMVICDFIRFKGEAGEGETEICRMMDDQYYEKEILVREHIQALNAKGWIAIWTALYDRNFLQRNTIRFNETPGASYQDTGFWFQTFCFAEKLYFIREPFYYYRFDNPNSSINDKGKVFTVCKEYDFIKKFFDRNPHLHKDFLPVYYCKKCNGYMWNYDRLEKSFKEPFLKKYSEEFKKDIEDGQFTGSMIYEERLNALMHLVKNPDEFLLLKEHG